LSEIKEDMDGSKEERDSLILKNNDYSHMLFEEEFKRESIDDPIPIAMLIKQMTMRSMYGGASSNRSEYKSCSSSVYRSVFDDAEFKTAKGDGSIYGGQQESA